MQRRTFIKLSGTALLMPVFFGCGGSSSPDDSIDLMISTDAHSYQLEDGSSLTVDTFNNLIHHKDENNTIIRSLGEKWSFNEDGQLSLTDIHFNRPRNVLQLEDMSYVVLDTHRSRVAHFAKDGSFLYHYTGNDTLNLVHPSDILLADNTLHVVDAIGKIHSYDPQTGQHLFAFGERGTSENQLNNPRGIAIDPSGRFHIAVKDNNTIAIYSPEGEYLKSYGEDLNSPTLISIDPQDGIIYTADNFNGLLHLYDQRDYRLIKTIQLITSEGKIAQPRTMHLQNKTLYLFATPSIESFSV